jgi:hypothetical protein
VLYRRMEILTINAVSHELTLLEEAAIPSER